MTCVEQTCTALPGGVRKEKVCAALLAWLFSCCMGCGHGGCTIMDQANKGHIVDLREREIKGA